MANLRSVQKAFEKLGHAAVVTGNPNLIGDADKLVLPGVGAFRDAIERLEATGLAEPYGSTSAPAGRFSASAWASSCCLPAATRTASTGGLTCFPATSCASRNAPA